MLARTAAPLLRPIRVQPGFTAAATRRTFITPPQQTFTATRRIAYPPAALFNLISDVASYDKFVPFCLASTVTATSPPPDRFPVRADLRVGWGAFDETFTSQVTCARGKNSGRDVAGGVVEADATQNSMFEVLRARWVIDGEGKGAVGGGEGRASKVDLEIDYKFANPLYAALSEAVMPSVAGKIVEAFEARAEQVLGKPRDGQTDS
ncbi:hypothetical protein TWF696_002558 [Orbilia brochopaga]|uniref:Coenzyme Q-binding protein COQ10 START domain-containing protein n=1 Tax=Orbilia brochopaga TaxID=3140254 RepID=A0AAV9U4Y6_9PEZI